MYCILADRTHAYCRLCLSVRLSIRPSRTLCIVAKRRHSAEVSEQVNWNYVPIGTRFYNFQPPIRTLPPYIRRLLNHLDVGAIWWIH